jgi:hypothetical protein
MLAYRRDAHAGGMGMSYQSGLWVTDLATGESRQVLDRTPAMFAWKPGTHLLAYGQGVEGYFTTRGEVDEALAKGIWGVDLDQEALEPVELVRPRRLQPGPSECRPTAASWRSMKCSTKGEAYLPTMISKARNTYPGRTPSADTRGRQMGRRSHMTG